MNYCHHGDIDMAFLDGQQCSLCVLKRRIERVKNFVIFFALQFVSYFNITVDMRAVNHDQYGIAAITNIVAPIIGWVMIKRVGEAKDKWGMVAVALGGVTSTWAGMYLTRLW